MAHNGFHASSGVQNHSAGPEFPIVTTCVGGVPGRDPDAYYLLSAYGVQRKAIDKRQRDDTTKKFLLAINVADSIYADRSGGTVWFDGGHDTGYVVGGVCPSEIFATIDRRYTQVLEAVLQLLQNTDGADGIGWWADDSGQTHIDMVQHYHSEYYAVETGRQRGEICVWCLDTSEEVPCGSDDPVVPVYLSPDDIDTVISVLDFDDHSDLIDRLKSAK